MRPVAGVALCVVAIAGCGSEDGRRAETTVVVAPFRNERVDGLRLAGLLCADVFSAYGRLTLDFRARRLVLGGSPPRDGFHLPLEIVRSRGDPEVVVRTRVRGSRETFLVDSGTTSTTIDEATARRLGLRFTGFGGTIASAIDAAAVRPVLIDRWSIGPVRLPVTRALATGPAARTVSERLAGALGADVLARFGRARLDYRREELVLGS